MRIGRNEKVYMLFAFKLTHDVFDRRQIGDRETNFLLPQMRNDNFNCKDERSIKRKAKNYLERSFPMEREFEI